MTNRAGDADDADDEDGGLIMTAGETMVAICS